METEVLQVSRSGETNIFVVLHTDKPTVVGQGYQTLHVGHALSAVATNALGDDTGENISRLNESFCELTGLYWMWKNTNSHIIGLVHYRRYFAPKRLPGLPFGDHFVASTDDFAELAGGVDLVVPTHWVWHAWEGIPLDLLNQYGRAHHSHDLFLARKEVLERTPEYRDAFDYVLASHTIAHHNMFVGRKAVVDDYCEWLFPVLFSLERQIPYEFYDGSQRRIFGFLAERLFNVWLCHNRARYRIVTRDIIRTEAGSL